jgi:hypothetical protein
VLSRLADGRVCGAGFFDDAADVPGQATLLFRLEGRWEENGTIRFTKRYEKAAGEYTVDYEGRWSEQSIEGSWRNALAGSFGSFFARVSSPESEVVALCEGCDNCIAPGAPRWKEEEQANDSRKQGGTGAVWCGNCASGVANLVPDTFAPLRQAHGSSCRQLLLNALTSFAENVLFGSFDSDSGTLEEHTYGEALRLATRVVFPKAIGGNDVVVISGPLNWNCVILTVSCVLRGIPLVSLERPDLVAPCCAGLSVAAVYDCAQPLTLSDSPAVDFDRPIQHVLPAPESPVAYLPTSGTSGAVPRLALFSDALCLPSEGLVRHIFFFFLFLSPQVSTMPFVRADVSVFDPSFLPSLLSTAQFGGSRYQCHLATLLAEFRRIRPTHFGAPPAVWQVRAFTVDQRIFFFFFFCFGDCKERAE